MRKYVLAALVAATAMCAVAVAPASAKTVWLCKPGQKNNPCEPSLSTTHVSPSGEKGRVERVRRVARPKVDCFYVYPTVSDDEGLQADRSIDPEMRSIALYQAARYSRDCRVFAPAYRQISLRGILDPSAITGRMQAIAYADVRDAWREYLRKYNKGRGVMLVGHSQGTFVLRELIPREVDGKPSVRRRVIAAYLLGGNVLVKKGEDDGGDFKNVPACRSNDQLHCVVAFSTYNAAVPENSRFGRSADPKLEVLCTNPANLRGGSGKLDAIQPADPFAPGTTIGVLTQSIGFVLPKVSTAWIESDNAYSARCVNEGGANVLQTAPLNGAPTLNALPDPGWGLHLADANLPLGNLVDLFKRQIKSYEDEQVAE